MSIFVLIVMIAAFLCFVFAAANVPSPRVNLVALGLALWIATQIPGLLR